MNVSKIILWAVKAVVAIILLQTLYFKFSAHPDSIYIFRETGLGAYGRIGTGIAELVAGLLILYPRTSWAGALFAIILMIGAIFFHLTVLGIEVNGDGGLLFKMALIVMVGSLYVFWKEKDHLQTIIARWRG